MRRLPPLNSIRAFEAAARLGSYSAAAEELSLTPGAVSHHIRLIESVLGIELFRHAGRGIRATPRAVAYADEIRACLERLGIATEDILDVASAKLIRINSLPILASHWLMPRLAHFQEQNPDIDFNLVTSGEPVQDLSDPFDVAFRRYQMTFPQFKCRVFMEDYHLPVCSPVFLRDHTLQEPKDVIRYTLLCHRAYPELWDKWLNLAGVAHDASIRRSVFASTFLALQAASEGLGVALAPIHLIAADLATGKLVAPFHAPIVRREPIQVLYPVSRLRSAAIRKFVRWILSEAEESHAA